MSSLLLLYNGCTAGGATLQLPSHSVVHVFVAQHTFGAELHSVPYVVGLFGVTALQFPSQSIVPLFVSPHAFGIDVHVSP
jgi:hypothetical protein